MQPQSNDNRTTASSNNDEMLHNYLMQNDPKYRNQFNGMQRLRAEDKPLEDMSADILGAGLAAREVGTGVKGLAEAVGSGGRKFSPEVAAKYRNLYDNTAQYGKENALYMPPNELHYRQLINKYTGPEGIAELDAYFQKVNPGAPTIDDQYQIIKSLPKEEGLAGMSQKDMMMKKKDWQEIWTGLQSRKKWDIGK